MCFNCLQEFTWICNFLYVHCSMIISVLWICSASINPWLFSEKEHGLNLPRESRLNQSSSSPLNVAMACGPNITQFLFRDEIQAIFKVIITDFLKDPFNQSSPKRLFWILWNQTLHSLIVVNLENSWQEPSLEKHTYILRIFYSVPYWYFWHIMILYGHTFKKYITCLVFQAICIFVSACFCICVLVYFPFDTREILTNPARPVSVCLYFYC